MVIDSTLVGLTFLCIILGIMSRGKTMYSISWIDSQDNVHELKGLCEHKKDIVQNALHDAANHGKVYYSSILVIKDRKK